MERFRSIPVLAIGIILSAPTIGKSEPYRDDARHFTLEVPEGWELMPPDVLAAANASGPDWMRKRTSGFVAGLRRQSDPRPGSPIILIQFEPGRFQNQSFDEIERELGKEYRKAVKLVNGKLSELGRQLSEESVLLDRAARRIAIRGRMDAGPVAASAYCIGHIGRVGIVSLNCYALKDELEQWRPTFDAIGESFHFDPGYEFEPLSPESGGWLVAVIGGAAVIGVAIAARLARRKNKPAASADPLQAPESSE